MQSHSGSGVAGEERRSRGDSRQRGRGETGDLCRIGQLAVNEEADDQAVADADDRGSAPLGRIDASGRERPLQRIAEIRLVSSKGVEEIGVKAGEHDCLQPDAQDGLVAGQGLREAPKALGGP